VNPLGIPDDEFEALVAQRRSEQFLAACRLPGIWLDRARLHKRAADILYEIAYEAWERDFARTLAEMKGQQESGSTSKRFEGQELEDFYDQRLLAEYLLLVGYGLECLLKGYLLTVIPELVIDEKRIDRLVANHDLPQLCHDCAISISADEERLLKLITRNIVWGKYTAP
jgi:hypothetical protein